MENATAPVAEVAIEDRIAAVFAGEPKPGAQPSQAEAPAEVPTEDAPTEAPETDEAPTEEEWLEIVHNAAPQRLTKAQAKDFAEKGYDYTQKTQKLAEERKQFQALEQNIKAREKLQPEVLKALATAEAYGLMLKQYEGVNWIERARSAPDSYAYERAQYDQIKDAANAAYQQSQQLVGHYQRLQSEEAKSRLNAEYQRAIDAVPEWKDRTRYQKDSKAIGDYLKSKGFEEDEINGLSDHRHVLILRDALAYQALKASQPQTLKKVSALSPVAKPGAAQTAAEVKAQASQDLKRQIKATRSDPHAQAKLIEQAFAAKIR